MIFAFLCKVDAKFGKVVMWENYPMKGKQTYKHKLSCQLPWEAIFQKDHYNLNSHAISTVMVIKVPTYRDHERQSNKQNVIVGNSKTTVAFLYFCNLRKWLTWKVYA